ncbi:Oidioi.mRNA.OKI2018_I69.chr2.g5912.t1.cds [Oikopleura dioica]|uniref:Oidioi.mRNA.OKI2018_I69.chr2.g5912.t1.cds n=1 Tax=Oikopleura dioica TaxID=34765 RepID=A0ABN7T1X7_OIKDI|nr:Oidioi.mRNA.OKI2018_I69.chr2.g5912.t1.cds [Oikopleura dioica]
MVTETSTWIEYSMKSSMINPEPSETVMWGQDFLHVPQPHVNLPPQAFQPPVQQPQSVPIATAPAHRQDPKKEERSNRRKMATQREKRRMEKLNHCIEDIRTIVCPDMKTPTKAKILREAINRILYLEKVTAEMMGKGMIPAQNQSFPEQPVQSANRSASPVENHSQGQLSPDSSYAEQQNYSPETSLAFAHSPDSGVLTQEPAQASPLFNQENSNSALPPVTQVVTGEFPACDYYVYETAVGQPDQPDQQAYFMQDEIVCYQYE